MTYTFCGYTFSTLEAAKAAAPSILSTLNAEIRSFGISTLHTATIFGRCGGAFGRFAEVAAATSSSSSSSSSLNLAA